GVTAVAFSPDGKLLATAGLDGTVRLRNPATGQAIGAPLQTGAQNGVTGMAFSPDGQLLATAGLDGTVRLWHPTTRQPPRRPPGPPPRPGPHTGGPGVRSSPDSKLLAPAGADGPVRLWQVSLFVHPYAALCADVGPPTQQEWNHYAPGELQPKVCG